MSIFEVILFVIGAVAIVAVFAFGAVHVVRDKRTRDERRADEHGDIAPGKFKITPGISAGDDFGGIGG
ncbi:hypothetical protein [Pedococcus bigeumensis]|uniref:Uncharacterized protein n=1 Tax=Pedococcus bigeumensis TaxID=433644 RepID=A0A502CL35_9MICO|nr:hypothetical protein [Pedococcus bigeumensis]TPG13937.1 hypothetical protein EAH86_17085 [Pedococcus bigeumensis]